MITEAPFGRNAAGYTHFLIAYVNQNGNNLSPPGVTLLLGFLNFLQ
jgi:hypothetical protein